MNDLEQKNLLQTEAQVSDELSSKAQNSDELSAEDLEAVAGGGIRQIWREVKQTASDVYDAFVG